MNIPKEFILFRWKEINRDNILSFLKMYVKHCRYSEYDDVLNKFSVKHDLGIKGSLFLKTFIEEMLNVLDIKMRSDIANIL
ncbi:MAG: hypothetical protein KatS3mg003_0560 [Candidatus Nitrosocaldaceae archaeon]|nr:MAG: hypothetical protein KatS3mg003_0560 [Candidatus Nitrosocaldaceae archaeon]